MKILLVCPALPYPLNNGGYIRIFNLVRGLATEGHTVDLLCIAYDPPPPDDLAAVREHCRQVEFATWEDPNPIREITGLLGRFIRGEPFFAKYVTCRDLRRRIREATGRERYDIVEFVHSHMAIHLDALHPNHGARTVLSTQDVLADHFGRMVTRQPGIAEKAKTLLSWWPMRRWEPRMAARFDRVLTVSERDRQSLLARRPDLAIDVVPNGVDTATFLPLPRDGRTENLLMVGTLGYPPNADAAISFCQKIFPLVRERVPNCTLTIVGKAPTAAVLDLNRVDGVEVHPDVDDVRPFYEKAMVSVVALRAGGGTRLKILESMALGTPVVSTNIGCEGLDVAPGENILVADDPDSFAGHVTSLLEDEQQWETISQAGRRLVENQYDWRPIAAKLAAIYEDLLAH